VQKSRAQKESSKETVADVWQGRLRHYLRAHRITDSAVLELVFPAGEQPNKLFPEAIGKGRDGITKILGGARPLPLNPKGLIEELALAVAHLLPGNRATLEKQKEVTDFIMGWQTTTRSLFSFEFFPDRATLQKFHNLDEITQNVDEVKMLLVGGSKLIEDQTNSQKITKAILPHPESASLLHYAKSVGDSSLMSKITATTRRLLDGGTDVSWYPHMINHAIILGDPERERGWALIESVLPCAPLSSRPCTIVYNPQFKGLISSIDDSFEGMFQSGEKPSGDSR
jgi:hypothetical protein